MNILRVAGVLLAAGLLSVGHVNVAAAQDNPDAPPRVEPSGRASRAADPDGQRRRAPPRAPTPEENLAAARGLLTAAGSSCNATEATPIGVTNEQQPAYEVLCGGAPGLVVVASTPPQIYDCLELAGQAMMTRERDPAADVGQQCANPVNTDVVRYVSAWSREAGLSCTVDEAAVIGKGTEGELVYEVGCQNADGFWLSRKSNGWNVVACWDVAIDNRECRFTTADERKGAWRDLIGSTEAQGCDVSQARRVGRDAEGLTVYELACGSGAGYFLRVSPERVGIRAATCEASSTVAGGCKLAAAAAAPGSSAPRD